MFKALKKIKINASVSKALRKLSINPEPLWSTEAFHLLVEAIVMGSLNEYEVAVCLSSMLPKDTVPPHTKYIIESWHEIKKINPINVEVACHLIIYVNNKHNFDGTFQDYLNNVNNLKNSDINCFND